MPCTYSAIDLRERERRREESKKRQIEKKKKNLVLALSELGFDLNLKTLSDGNTLITGEMD